MQSKKFPIFEETLFLKYFEGKSKSSAWIYCLMENGCFPIPPPPKQFLGRTQGFPKNRDFLEIIELKILKFYNEFCIFSNFWKLRSPLPAARVFQKWRKKFKKKGIIFSSEVTTLRVGSRRNRKFYSYDSVDFQQIQQKSSIWVESYTEKMLASEVSLEGRYGPSKMGIFEKLWCFLRCSSNLIYYNLRKITQCQFKTCWSMRKKYVFSP